MTARGWATTTVASAVGPTAFGYLSELVAVMIPAVVPTVTGTAWITTHAQIVVDPTDPYPAGYTVGDIWG